MLLSLRRLALLALLVVAFAGCGRIAFVSDRFDNFTAYYNTFYNAEKSYTEGVEALEQTEEPVDRRVYMSIFEAPGQSTDNQKFQAAVDKSADVLRGHPESKWVDDALVLIGKSYFYQQNYVGAEQKFREVMGMVSPLEDEARLWLARTLIAAGAHDEAREHLLVSLNREDLSKRWEPSLRLALGELYVKRADNDDAIEELSKGLENVRDNRYEARAAFLLGQVYETVGQYEKAVEAYERVSNAHPRYPLSYAALYSAVRVQGLHVDAEAALRSLRRMERDDKNYSNRFELAYLRGRIYQSQGYAGDARALFEEILYDSDEPITDVRGRLHYALGELYRDAFLDYRIASAYFDTARTALQTAAPSAGGRLGPEIAYAPEAIVDSEEQSAMFGSFADVRGQIAEMDSLLNLGSLSNEEFAARILEIRRALAVEMAENERRAARLQAERGFQNAAAAGTQRDTPAANAASTASGTAGFLFHRDPVRVQEGRMNFISRWGERPLARNWRRIEAIQGVAANADSERNRAARGQTDLDPSVGDNPLPPLDYSNVPRDSLSQAAMRARRAVARYELANVLFLSMERPDSAATWYRTVIEEDADFPVAQRAFYALAEVHSSMGDSLAARRLYEQVLEDYPSSDFAGRVRERLGIRIDVPSDTLALAEEDYDQAYQRWRRGSYQQALDHMVEVAASYPRMEVAPRALLAAGRIYMEWARRDSMDVFAPLPLTVSDSTLSNAGLLGITVPQSPATSPPTGAPSRPGGADATSGGAAANGAPSAAAAAAEAATRDAAAAAGAATRDAAAETAERTAQLVAERRRARGDVPSKGQPGTELLVDDTARPPSKGRAGEIPAASGSEPVPDELAAEIPPQGGARPADAAAAQQTPEVLTPTDDDLTNNQQAARADSTDAQLALPPPDENATLPDEDAPPSELATSPPDTTDVLPAVAAAADDSAYASADPDSSTAALLDSSNVGADSVAADAGPSGLIAAVEQDDHIYLKTLYVGVKQNYPQTAYATQADLLLKALKDRESELQAAADSVAAVAAAAADSAAALIDGFRPGEDSLDVGTDSLDVLAKAISEADTTAAPDTTTAAGDAGADAADAAGAVDPDTTDNQTTIDESAEAVTAVLADDLVDPSDAAESVDSAAAGAKAAPDSVVVPLAEESAAEAAPAGDAPAGDASAGDAPAGDAPAGDAPAGDAPAGDAAAEATIPIGEDAIRGEGGIRKELGGYTLIIGMDTKEATMRAMANKYAAKGFRTDVIVEQGADETVYRAAIGHFASQRDAGVLLQKYLTQFEETVQLAPLSDFE